MVLLDFFPDVFCANKRLKTKSEIKQIDWPEAAEIVEVNKNAE